MKPSSVYRKAARRIVSKKNLFCCSAIADSTDIHTYSNRLEWDFIRYFKPYMNELFFESTFFWFGRESINENQLARSLALLLMAEIVKDA